MTYVSIVNRKDIQNQIKSWKTVYFARGKLNRNAESDFLLLRLLTERRRGLASLASNLLSLAARCQPDWLKRKKTGLSR